MYTDFTPDITNMQKMRITNDYIIQGPWEDLVIPETDMWSFLKQSLLQTPDATAMIDTTTQASITFGEFHYKAEKIAASLYHMGYDRHYPLSIYMPNSIEYALISTAAWILGGSCATISSLNTVSEIHNALEMLESEFLCCGQKTVSNSIEAAKNTNIKKILIAGEHKGCISILSLLGNETPFYLPKVSIDPVKDTALIQFSGGTTGLPKAVEISHSGLIKILCVFADPRIDLIPSCIIVYQPFSHIYGCGLWTVALTRMQKLLIMPSFELEKYISLVSSYKCTMLFFVPPIAVMLSKSDLVTKYELSHVTTIFCGAAPLGKNTEEDLIRMFKGRIQLRQLYGLTEVGILTAIPPKKYFPNELCPGGSVGLPVSSCQIKVVDVATGKNLPPLKEGELWAKTTSVMKGYRNNTKATNEMLDKDGWLHTGDIVYYDENGYLFVVDRMKELIKYKAYQVAPAELEALLLRHPYIADCGVTAIPDEECGEIPHAWVVRKPNTYITEAQIQKFVNENAAPYKRLRGGVRFVEIIPKSLNGKILRREIKRLTLHNKSNL